MLFSIIYYLKRLNQLETQIPIRIQKRETPKFLKNKVACAILQAQKKLK
jgi:hypothetical protein